MLASVCINVSMGWPLCPIYICLYAGWALSVVLVLLLSILSCNVVYVKWLDPASAASGVTPAGIGRVRFDVVLHALVIRSRNGLSVACVYSGVFCLCPHSSDPYRTSSIPCSYMYRSMSGLRL